ncbi:sigma-70 family RNA polymerase sigma factor [Flaviflagellibacter deserti]|uniref:Sigma-70 family RNA polymerase sigma factor n=1 Tax=Flaviflagellibacter deserti TaxID=2267266 RepID=A0ABV9YY90_9HYPH
MPLDFAPSTPDLEAAEFDKLRPRLTRIAYRMLGSWAEAEDVVQDAWIRWQRADRSTVREPAAFLTRTVSRLSLDVLKAARTVRETYIGPWLPEPILDETLDDDDGDGITGTLMLALERLSPLERAAFLLHDVFGMGFDEVAQSIDREPAACRQLAARARDHIRASRPRFPVSEQQGREIAQAFFAASRSGDASMLTSLLAADVVTYSDGGGKVKAAINILNGADRLVRFMVGLSRKGRMDSTLLREGLIDGLPGFVSREPHGVLQTTAFEIEDGRITAVYIMRNPDKLKQVSRFLPN